MHRSVAELNADIVSFIDAQNEKPKPRGWVKSADVILASVRRFRFRANKLGAGEEVQYELRIRETKASSNLRVFSVKRSMKLNRYGNVGCFRLSAGHPRH